MQFMIRRGAGEHRIFASGAFDSQIGKIIPVNLRETEDSPVIGEVNQARLVRADIIEQGKIAELTFEAIDHDSFEKPVLRSPMSFGFSVR